MFLEILNKDFSKNVQESTYKVDSVPVYEEWQDANKKFHREITRQRVVGSFDIVFFDGWGSSIQDFYSVLASSTDNGITKCSVFVSNKNEVKEIDCFLNYKTSRFTSDVNSKNIIRLSVSVEEV